MKWYWILLAGTVLVTLIGRAVGLLAFDAHLPWYAWLVAPLVLVNGGWMAFDGGRALVTGDYVTPSRRQMAGQLGPWAKLVEAIGIPPRSTGMKFFFLGYGVAYLVITLLFLLGVDWAWLGFIVMAILGLWYIPFGTLINLIVIILLMLPGMAAVGQSAG